MIRLDLIRQAVSGTPGTGNITLSTAITGYIGIADHPDTTDGMLVEYCIVDGNNKEFGIGTYTATGTVLARTWIQGKLDSGVYSKNPGTGLSLTSAAIVSCGPVATNLNFRGCLLKHASAQTLTTSGTTYTLNWDTEVYDTDGFHDIATNNSRITIPSGVTLIQLVGNCAFDFNATGDRIVRVYKNGAGVDGGGYNRAPAVSSGSGDTILPVSSAWLYCQSGDYFELAAAQFSGGSLDVNNPAAGTVHFFAMRVIQ